LRRVHALELLLEPEREDRLAGCGLLLVNPPWPILDRVGEIMPALAARLARDGAPRTHAGDPRRE
jgi:23S rRNA A2030 N6-methylase RlmJ